MIQKIHDYHVENCEFCSADPDSCVPGSGPTKTKLVLVGEAPGKEEKYGGEPFIGPAGRLLREMISSAGVSEKKLRFENIVRFWPQDEKGFTRQPTNKEVVACIPYLYDTLLEILKTVDVGDSLHILAFGNVALEALTGNKKITSNRGIVFPLKVLDHYKDVEKYKILGKSCKVIGAIHPSAVLRGSSNYQPKIVSDISFAWKLATGSIPKYWNDYRWMEDPDDFEVWVDMALEKYKNGDIEWLSYDLETTGLETYDLENHYTVCASFCIEPQKAIVVPLRHKDSPWKNDKFTEQRVLKDMQRLLEVIPLCGWNLSYDIKWTWLHLKLNIKEIGFDGFLARRWLFQSHGDNDLNSCAAQELGFVGHGNELEAELAALPKDQQHYGNISKEVMIIYAAGDADAALQLSMKYKEMMVASNLFEPYKEMMVDGLLPVCEMEVDGVCISKDTNDYLIELYPRLMEPHLQLVENSQWGQSTAAVLAKRINKDGKAKPLNFNLGSVATMQELLFNQMRMPVVEQGKTGPSSDREVVETLLEWCTVHKELEKKKVLESINELRALKHTYNNFIKNIEEYIKYDGLFHTNYNIGGTDSGRFSSSKPSLHGQPKGSEARWQFVSRWRGAGGIICSSDMKQMEVRILASLSNDQNLIDAISSGVDIHTANASKMFKVPIEKVDKNLRDRAKRCSFGVIYGIGAQTLASRIESTVAEAQGIIDAWYEAFPKTFEFQKNEFKIAKKYGYVSTNFGRIRKIDNIEMSKWGDRAWRQTINLGIQSSASDVTYLAMRRVKQKIKEAGMRSKVFGFVHDAIITDVFPGELWDLLDILREAMIDWTNSAFDWMKAPIDADCEIGVAWGYPCGIQEKKGDYIKVEGGEKEILLLNAELSNFHGYEKILLDSTDSGKMHLEFSRELPF